MASYKLVFLFFTSFLYSAATEAADITFLGYACNLSKTFTANSAYQFDLSALFSSLSSNATANIEFYNTTVTGRNPSDTIHGLFMCRGDVPHQICRDCVGNATVQASSVCPIYKEAIVWYDQCFVRYSDRYFFSKVETSPPYGLLNNDSLSQGSYLQILFSTLNLTADEAANATLGAKKYATTVATISGFGTMYSIVQCTPDLSPQDCRRCLSDVIGELPQYSEGRRGGRLIYPSCNVRYELYPFLYSDTQTVATTPAPAALLLPTNSSDPRGKGKGKGQSPRTIVIVVGSIVVAVTFFYFAYCLLRSKMKKRHEAVLRQNYFGSEGNTLESLQFSLATIEAATNKFSNKNSIGKGGFGEVYKGVLVDGREIAVKRLSKSSGQGAVEFKNEVLLIAKLQHRNLVALLGFCLEEQEKILVYEFVPNRSLDYFLFGTQKNRVLNWPEHYKIIRGIARGILYLHEYSRLKIIHRDLKPSNILLDDDMNPKISDFGLAKMVAINETKGNTNRIVGTYGYMSPEYAMFGRYSEKSDIFSFGVIVLEIISGKKNTSCHESQYVDGLLSYAWKQWRDENFLEILDSNIKEFGSYNEVIKYIQIGLLCVQENPDARPSMTSIVSYLRNDSTQLPFPQEPAFFIHGRMEPTNGNRESSSDQSIDNSKSGSINEMSITKFFPR